MAERAHPFDKAFKDRFFGLIKNPYRKLLFERYQFCNRYIAGRTVLEIPCGTGWGTSMLIGVEKIVGVDIHAESVKFAKEHYGSEVLTFQVGDMRNLEFPDSTFDVIICLEGFEHVTKEIGQAFIAETRRVLKNDGLLIMTCPIIVEGGAHSGNPYHVYEYPEHELLEIINENFNSIRIEEIPAPDNPVIQFVGRIRK